MTTTTTYSRWFCTEGYADQDMEPSAIPSWEQMIRLSGVEDLSQADVMNFGCNTGGFLRLLHRIHPYRFALGIDVAAQSIEDANRLKGNRPVEHRVVNDLGKVNQTFDAIYSHEVLWLLSDLRDHARKISQCLKPAASYYAVLTDVTTYPLWSHWKKLLGEMTSTSAQMNEYPPEFIAEQFRAEGFKVRFQPYGVEPPQSYYSEPTLDLWLPTRQDRWELFRDYKYFYHFKKI